MILAQLGVAFRAAVVAAFGYTAWAFVSGSAFQINTWASLAMILWILANAAFYIAKWYRPDLLETAKRAEEEL